MDVWLPGTVAVIGVVELVIAGVVQFGAVLGVELALGLDEARVVVGPLLDRRLGLRVVELTGGGASVGIEVVAIGVHVLPRRDVGLFSELSLVERLVRAIGAMRHAHRVLVEGSYGHHRLVFSVVGEVVLDK